MQFETSKSTQEKIGEKAGKIIAFLIFSIAAFFLAGKIGAICWSIKKYAYFAIALALTLLLIDNITRGLSGREKNKIVS